MLIRCEKGKKVCGGGENREGQGGQEAFLMPTDFEKRRGTKKKNVDAAFFKVLASSRVLFFFHFLLGRHRRDRKRFILQEVESECVERQERNDEAQTIV
jgi:hypothetical protein